MRCVLTQTKERKALKLQTDAGKEFYNGTFQELMKREKIHHFSTHGDAKASVVERFNRTLKSKLYRYFIAANTLRFVQQYNETYHRSIGMAPAKVTPWNVQDVWHRLYNGCLKEGKK